MLSRQEIFNTVATKLLAQGVAAASPDGKCFYRGPNGTKCAAGHLIPDEKYYPTMEHKPSSNERVMQAMGIDETDKWLVRELQGAHDDELRNQGIDVWKKKMRFIASYYKLDPSVLD
jgi:hypothetical protein